jgi:DNA-directed RNA polymerase specialized sigma24 family protein
MPRNSGIPPDGFNELLAWLNPDRDLAARMYEEIRRDLIKVFGWNKCIDPEGMADETFDRVAKKAHQLKDSFEGNRKLFFYGVANNLIKEYRKTVRSYASLDEVEIAEAPPTRVDEETVEAREECLRTCLLKLTVEKRDLLIAYYAKEKRAKIDQRAKMARRLAVSIETLRVRMCRIRSELGQCVGHCLDERAIKNDTD